MFGIIRLASGIAATVFAGWVILRLILGKERRPFAEEAALAYGLGMAAVSLEYLIFWALGLKPTLINILMPYPVLFLAAFFIKKEIFITAKTPGEGPSGYALFEKFLLVGIFFEVFHSFLRSLIKPIE